MGVILNVKLHCSNLLAAIEIALDWTHSSCYSYRYGTLDLQIKSDNVTRLTGAICAFYRPPAHIQKDAFVHGRRLSI